MMSREEFRRSEHEYRDYEGDVVDEEYAEELSVKGQYDRNVSEERADQADYGKGYSYVGIALTVLSFWWLHFIFAAVGLVLGVLGVRRGSEAGWVAIALGVIALIIHTILIPLRVVKGW